jgi:hypothetical protein
MTTRRASCSCGQLAALCDGDPVRVSICHCLECQRRTGSSFGVTARYAEDRVQVEGRATHFTRRSDDGNAVTFSFCQICGSTVFWQLQALPGCIAVAVGCFADPGFPAPQRAVYGERRHSWVDLPASIEQTD